LEELLTFLQTLSEHTRVIGSPSLVYINASDTLTDTNPSKSWTQR
jgi:hypothetical protein